jgi:hypothetical protein
MPRLAMPRPPECIRGRSLGDVAFWLYPCEKGNSEDG